MRTGFVNFQKRGSGFGNSRKKTPAKQIQRQSRRKFGTGLKILKHGADRERARWVRNAAKVLGVSKNTWVLVDSKSVEKRPVRGESRLISVKIRRPWSGLVGDAVLKVEWQSTARGEERTCNEEGYKGQVPMVIVW